MKVIKFTIEGDQVHFGAKDRQKLTKNGCNEPYKDRYWCPKKKWFNTEPCPFKCQRECDNYETMCGII